ncbi:hypothetical protein DPMN_122209 [Dreissena polymorpha]|uniref:Uncharacterized protein n=1 Tax=Dreissena polymorpha TaxID=45954 RepID=A0A9D4GP80_DREPO|nr:hypothetical protein DPMN_122209 [Dreissena polymorpha]
MIEKFKTTDNSPKLLRDALHTTEKQSRNRLGEATLESLIRLCLHTERLGEKEVTRIIDKFAEKPRNVEL